MNLFIFITYCSTVVPFNSCVFLFFFLTRKKNATIEWDDGGKIGNKNKLILTEIFPLVHET